MRYDAPEVLLSNKRDSLIEIYEAHEELHGAEEDSHWYKQHQVLHVRSVDIVAAEPEVL